LNQQPIIWLASWPRSGNTLLRTVLWHCFKLKSASVYPKDFDGSARLEKQIGHIEYNPDKKFNFPLNNPQIFKTHEHPPDNNPAIFVVRDGRAACVSLWNFYKKENALEAIISGRHRFGSWADHIAAWNPGERDNSLIIKYETILSNLPGVLENLSQFLEQDIISNKIPGRDDMASIEGRWVRKKTDWQEEMGDAELDLFERVNGKMMKKMGYT